MTNILSVLIRVQTVCKDYTCADPEFFVRGGGGGGGGGGGSRSN